MIHKGKDWQASMKIITEFEPVHYVIHNDVRMNAYQLLDMLNSMKNTDKTTFETKYPSHMAILDLIHRENEAVKAEKPYSECIRSEYRNEKAVILHWEDNEELVERIKSRVYSLLEQAESGKKT